MTTKQNLHTHTVISDGKSTISEVVESAVKFGLKSLGFSDHMYTGLPFDVAGMYENEIDTYFEELERLKKTAPIKIFAGLELESIVDGNKRPEIDKRCDYTIGSVHFFYKDGKHQYVDWDLEHYLLAVEAFNGPKAMCENYYTEIVDFAKKSAYDITGHFDLLTKFLDMTDMSFTYEKWYKDLAFNAMEEVAKCGKIFEINTGAISRGWRKTPYPQDFLIKHLYEIKAPIIISADSHHKDSLTCFFPETEEILKRIGFKYQMQLSENGFTEVPL